VNTLTQEQVLGQFERGRRRAQNILTVIALVAIIGYLILGATGCGRRPSLLDRNFKVFAADSAGNSRMWYTSDVQKYGYDSPCIEFVDAVRLRRVVVCGEVIVEEVE
jgi:hypothetical protein